MLCEGRAKPLMYRKNGKELGQKRIDYFMKNKYPILCERIGTFDSCFMFYKASAIGAMSDFFFGQLGAKGVRVYFASYKTGVGDVPEGHDNLMTLIFAPTREDGGNHLNLDLYYTIPPQQEFDPLTCKLNTEVARVWIQYYQDLKLPSLTAGMGSADTKSIYYEDDLISDLVAELDCQQAAGLKMYLAGVHPTEEVPDPTKLKHKQLMLEFILTRKIGGDESDFSVEDTPGFADRPNIGDLDTGSPCPPASCNGSLLP